MTSNSVSNGFGRLLAAATLALSERSEFAKVPKAKEQNFLKSSVFQTNPWRKIADRSVVVKANVEIDTSSIPLSLKKYQVIR